MVSLCACGGDAPAAGTQVLAAQGSPEVYLKLDFESPSTPLRRPAARVWS